MDILMPQPGETVTEAQITVWFKAVGDAVIAGEPLFEIDTDKTAMEIPSSVSGILAAINVAAGETAAVGTVIASLRAGDMPAAVPAIANAAVPAEPAACAGHFVRTPPRNFGPATLPGGARVTPLARRLAVEAGIDPARVRGSGPHGRIIAADIRAEASLAHPLPVPEPAPAPRPAEAASDPIKALYADVPFEEVMLDGMRRTIARRLVESKQTVPHFYLSIDVDMEALLKLRQDINLRANTKISVNDFVMKAFALALARVPAANAVWAEDRILRFAQVDLGVAISVEGGLYTPVVRAAQGRSLGQISAEIKRFARLARERKLTAMDCAGGSAAVSNLGMYGVRQFQAIINPPHATILAIGAVDRRLCEAPDQSAHFRPQLTATLSADHRVVDGAVGAELLAAFKMMMEAPLSMLV